MPKTMIDGVVTEITQQQLDAITFQPPATAKQVRAERDALLTKTDWWATSDRTMTAEQTAYRQALRDITDQAGFPEDVTWPQEPTS